VKVRGLFIGIDRYPVPINRLTCAVADARAIGSLFEDTLDGEYRFLLDNEAGRDAVLRALGELSQADEGDLVVITFSGHGTDDHRLVPVDADAGDLRATCIGLDEVAAALDAIPSRQLLVVLDCCFSGGFGGARVFAPTQTRSVTEDRSSVEALARGSGRIVITASGPGEPAHETVEVGHGLLSNFLIDGLQGMNGLAKANRVAVLELFNYAMQRVMSAAERMRSVQTPTLYGSIDGAPTLAVLSPGARYAAAFPSRVRLPATSDWKSLAGVGFSDAVLHSWQRTMPGLNDLQTRAINDYGVLDGKSLLVVAPTGAGKTMIGELAAVKAVAEGSRAVMLLPLKALVNDKFLYMNDTYGDQMQVVRATGDNSDQVGVILSGQYDIALLTYEKFMSLVLGNSHIMLGVSVVIVDEVQMLGDRSRGPSLEFLLTLLRAGHGRLSSPQIVALSAVIGETRGLEHWLGGELLATSERPVPLRECVLDRMGGRRVKEPDGAETQEAKFIAPRVIGGSQSNKPWMIPLVQRLVSEGKKVIVFRALRGKTVGTARYLARSLGLPPALDALELLPQGDRSAASEELRSFLESGVGFHNSDLDRDERLALETCFRDPKSPLRVLAATTTLAMGVNTPAEAVVIAGLTHPGRPSTPYSVAEYKNMAGRAGRLGHTEAGESYIVATSHPGPTDAWQRYVLGQPEPIVSHFLADGTDPQTLIVRSLVALGSSVIEADLVELLENSFAVWLRREAGQSGWDEDQLRRDLECLITARLLDREPDGHLTLTALGRFAGESGIEVRSITHIASAVRFAPSVLSEADLITLAQVTVEMEQLWIPANRSSRKEQQRWPMTLHHLGTNPRLLNSLHVGGTDPFDAIKRAVACLLFASARPMAAVERELLQHYRDSAAAGNIRKVARRTRDVLDAVVRIAAYNGIAINDCVDSDALGLRLEFGLPDELVPLARVAGVELNRGQYLQLLEQGLLSPQQVVDAGAEALGTLLDPTTAERLLVAVTR